MENIIKIAYNAATIAHQGQYRRYSKEPYFVHPYDVAMRYAKFLGKNLIRLLDGDDMEGLLWTDELSIATAFLHDVLEDTEYTKESLSELLYILGASHDHDIEIIVDDVSILTNKEFYSSMEAKYDAIEKKLLSTDKAWLSAVKVMDCLSNCHSLLDTPEMVDEKYAMRFLNVRLTFVKNITNNKSFRNYTSRPQKTEPRKSPSQHYQSVDDQIRNLEERIEKTKHKFKKQKTTADK